jgi:hypothetical protein
MKPVLVYNQALRQSVRYVELQAGLVDRLSRLAGMASSDQLAEHCSRDAARSLPLPDLLERINVATFRAAHAVQVCHHCFEGM